MQRLFACLSSAGLLVAAFEDEYLQVVMAGEKLHLQVQAVMEDEKKLLHDAMEAVGVQMEGGGCPGRSGCRQGEGRKEMEEKENLEAKDCCVLGKAVGEADRAQNPLSIVCQMSFHSQP